MKYIFKALTLAAATCLVAACSEPEQSSAPTQTQESKADDAFADHLSGAAFVTADLEATLDFYKRFVGLVQPRPQRLLKDEATLAVYGVTDGTPIPYAALVPKGWPDLYPGHPGVNFAEIKSGAALLPQTLPRTARPGEPIMAFSVRDIEAKAKAMEEAGVQIDVPLALSGTGRSMAITVLDPSGMRVQLYQFIK